jgi:pimeloyl-ACP methyl ester carboxylesterase
MPAREPQQQVVIRIEHRRPPIPIKPRLARRIGLGPGIGRQFRKEFRGTTLGFVRGMFPPGADPNLVERVAGDMASAPPAVAVSALSHTLSNGPNIPPALATLNLPVVAINADRHPTDHASMKKHGVKAFVMPDSGHFLMMEDPVRFNRSLDSVIKGFAP